MDRDAQRRVLEQAPPLTGTGWDALLAAMAKYLAELHGHPVQQWMDEPERFLDETWVLDTNTSVRLDEQAVSAIAKALDTRARTHYATEYLVVTGASAEHMLAMKLETGRGRDMGDIARSCACSGCEAPQRASTSTGFAPMRYAPRAFPVNVVFGWTLVFTGGLELRPRRATG